MGDSIRVLIVEDRPEDAELMIAELRRHGYEPDWRCVDGEGDYLEALDKAPEVILSDFYLPGFSAVRALELLQGRGLDIPFMVVTGSIGEEVAVEVIKRGAADYLLKDRLTRLGPAVERALAERRLREQAARALSANLQAKEDWERTFDAVPDLVSILDLDYRVVRANRALATKLGRTPPECVGVKCFQVVHGSSEPPPYCPQRRLMEDGREHTQDIHEDRLCGDFAVRVSPLHDVRGSLIGSVHVARDVTERRRAEAARQRQLDTMTALRDIDIAISSSLDLRITLQVLLEKLTTRLGVDAADVLLLDPNSLYLNYAAGRGFNTTTIENTHVRLGRGQAGEAALERRAIINCDLPDAVTHSLKEEGFQSYIAMPLTARGRVTGVLEIFHRSRLDPTPELLGFLELLSGQAAIAIDNATMFVELQRSHAEITLAYDTTLEGWARTLELRDADTQGHTRRVTEMSMRLARALGCHERDLVNFRRGALLHDIGKICIPDGILRKPGPLNEEETLIMQRHPGHAFDLLSAIPFLRPAVDIPFCHHERWDGSGYPRGLKGREIPFEARVFAVVDVADALISDRPYRAAWPVEDAYAHIRSMSGIHFDPDVTAAFLELPWQR